LFALTQIAMYLVSFHFRLSHQCVYTQQYFLCSRCIYPHDKAKRRLSLKGIYLHAPFHPFIPSISVSFAVPTNPDINLSKEAHP
jgi:hypothetical protein